MRSPLRDRAGDQKRARFNPVADDGVVGAAEPLDAFDPNRGRARAFDLRAHFREQIGQVLDLGLLRGVFENGLAAGQSRRHHQIFGAGDGDAVKVDPRAAQPVAGVGLDVAVRLIDACAENLEAGDVQIDRTRADGAASGQRNARPPGARRQRSQHQARRAHGLDQLVGRLRRRDFPCFEAYVIISDVDRRSDIDQQPLHGADVAHLGNAAQRDGLGGQQRGRQSGQRRVLRAAGRNRAGEGAAAPITNLSMFRFFQCRGDTAAGGFEHPLGRGAIHTGAAHHDGGAHAIARRGKQFLRPARRSLQPPGRRSAARGRAACGSSAPRSPSDFRRRIRAG